MSTTRDVQMEDGTGVEDEHTQEDNCECNSGTDAKTKRSNKAQRRRITGGGGILGLRNLTRRGSLGSHLNENFDPSDQSSMTDSKLILKCQVKLILNSLTRPRFLFLYEDVLICAKQKSQNNFHIKFRVNLHDIWLSDDVNDLDEADTSSSSKAESFHLGWPIANVELEFLTIEEKNCWVEKLRELLVIARKEESPNIIIRIVKNDEKYTVTKSFYVGNCDSIKQILSRCMKVFHIESDTSKNGFQLHVLANKTEVPVPLTGREILYRIQMKYNREHSEICRDPTAEIETENVGDGLVFQLIPGEKKSSILKRSLANDDNKPAKRASLARFFRMTFKLADEGRLYRRNLSELCKDGKICWRLMMMLSHLYLHGPTYEEVFRKPPALKVHRMLQEKLDRGKDFNFDKVNACEMSQLLKSFLSCLPECLLTVELYDEWSEVVQQDSREARIFLAKSLVERLPDCNRVLLHHLICVLNRISSDSKINGMPPKSLSICIGQCLLWLPPLKTPAGSIDSELHRFGIANRIAEILIEDARDIFGEKCLSLFDHLLLQPPLISTINSKDSSNVGCCQETDTTNLTSVLRQESTSSDHYGITRSVSCLNYSTMSLTEETKDNEIELLREVSEEVALKLNSSWHLSGTNYEPKSFVSLQAESNHTSSHSSSQIELFLENQSIKDDEDEMNVNKEQNSVESSLVLDQLSTEERLLTSPLSKVDTIVISKHLNSVVSKDSSDIVDANATIPAEALFSDNVQSEMSLSRGNKSSNDESNFAFEERLNTSLVSPHRTDWSSTPVSDKALPASYVDSSPMQMSVFLETPETASVRPAEHIEDNTLPIYARSTTIDLEQSNKTSSSDFSRSSKMATNIKSVKLKPQTLVMPSTKAALESGCGGETLVCSPNVQNSTSTEVSYIENKTQFTESKTSTPDDGYDSPSNTISRGCVTGKQSDLLPLRLERSFTENQSPAKLCLQSPLDGNLTKLTLSGGNRQSDLSTSLSLSFVKNDMSITPPGIVRRLTSEITQREITRNSPPKIQLSPKLTTPKTKFQSPFSPALTRNTSSDACASSRSPGSVFYTANVGLTSNEHSQSQHSNRTAWRPEFPKSPQTSDAGKQRLIADQKPVSASKVLPGVGGSSDNNKVQLSEPSTYSEILRPRKEPMFEQRSVVGHLTKPNDDVYKRDESKDSCFKISSVISQVLTESNAEPSKDTTKQLVEQMVLPLNREDSGYGTNVSLMKTDKILKNEELDARNMTLDADDVQKKSTKPRLHNSDLKSIAPNPSRQIIDRSQSDICEIVSELTQDEKMTTENKENSIRYQQLKRLSITRQSSTPEKVSKISSESNDVGDIDDDTSCSPENKNMSVKNRDWHKELTEQYTIPAPSAGSNLELESKHASKKPAQRSAIIGPKISFTPMPLRVFHGNSSRVAPATATIGLRKT